MAEKAKAEEQDMNHTQEDQENNPQPDTHSDHSSHEQSENNSSSQNEGEDDNALTELQEKYDKLNDKYLRLYSEFENFRRRTAKERIDLIKNAGSDVVRDILPVIDDFERAIASNEKTEDADMLKEGFELIHNKLFHILQSKGLKPMNSMNQPFDTEYHEAITNIPAPTDEMKGKVVDVAEKGYFFNDQILRYAKVVVGQ